MLLTPEQAAQRAGLVADVIASPLDDGPRLVFADWCEDHGDPVRAEFVRVQLALSRLPPRHLCCAGEKCPACSPLRRREEGLWPSVPLSEFGGGGVPGGTHAAPHTPLAKGGYPRVYVWRRGFPDEARMELAALTEGGPALAARFPLTRMTATDRNPAVVTHTGRRRWWADTSSGEQGADLLPPDVWLSLPGGGHENPGLAARCKEYDGDESAREALSDALLLLARRH